MRAPLLTSRIRDDIAAAYRRSERRKSWKLARKSIGTTESVTGAQT
jgi:hypothetical protein